MISKLKSSFRLPLNFDLFVESCLAEYVYFVEFFQTQSTITFTELMNAIGCLLGYALTFRNTNNSIIHKYFFFLNKKAKTKRFFHFLFFLCFIWYDGYQRCLQLEGPGFELCPGSFVWSLHVLSVHTWALSGYYVILPQSKNMTILN